MEKILSVLRNKNIQIYQSEKFNLDSFYFDSFQDDGESFDNGGIFETDNKSGKIVSINQNISTSFFKYFIDGSRFTYKIGDMSTTDGKFLPIIAGQIGTACCERLVDGRMKAFKLLKNNVMLLYNNTNKDDLLEMKAVIESMEVKGVKFNVDTYQYNQSHEGRPEHSAITTIQGIMSDMEIKLLNELVSLNFLKPREMLVIDGSLQFMNAKANDRLFTNVIGISKTYNPNLKNILKTKSKEIGTFLPKLKFGERTPVYKYPVKNRVIGAWYIRIRQEDSMRNPLDGIVKIEKIATTDREKEDGFESGLIDNISKSILLERNVTCYGNDLRWANHIYPIYATEKYLKTAFLSDSYFLNLF